MSKIESEKSSLESDIQNLTDYAERVQSGFDIMCISVGNPRIEYTAEIAQGMSESRSICRGYDWSIWMEEEKTLSAHY